MDTSETYIEMCEKAKEIQELNSRRSELHFPNTNVAVDPMGNYFAFWKFVDMDLAKAVWLPRQDQLQEMVGGFAAGMVNWYSWRNNTYPEMQNPFNKKVFNSYEQLWLAFVMKEKYGKVWSGEDWVASK